MKRLPLALGDECAFWTIISGPTMMGSGKHLRSHWQVRCRCGAERFHTDSNLRRLRDGVSADKFWSCGCVSRQLQRDVTTRYYRNAFSLAGS